MKIEFHTMLGPSPLTALYNTENENQFKMLQESSAEQLKLD